MVNKMSKESPYNAVVTGASQGIGKAIAIALAGGGYNTILAGRSIESLRNTEELLSAAPGRSICKELDLSDPLSVSRFCADVGSQFQRLDVLINCGGAYDRGSVADTSPERIDNLHKVNVLGTYAVTRSLIPNLSRARGDIVFINSTAVFSNAESVSSFAMTQHALLAFANALRAEVNDLGVRVLTIHPGRTATPRQEQIFATEGRTYNPQNLLQPADVAQMVLACVKLAETAEVTDIRIRPRNKYQPLSRR